MIKPLLSPCYFIITKGQDVVDPCYAQFLALIGGGVKYKATLLIAAPKVLKRKFFERRLPFSMILLPTFRS